MITRKFFVAFIVCLSAILFGASMSMAADKNDYYPLTVGSEWIMQVKVLEDNSVIEQKLTVENPNVFENITYSVMKQVDPKNKYTVLILKNNKGVYWRKLALKKSFVPEMNGYYNPQTPYMQFPLTKGSKWEWQGILALPWGDKNCIWKFEIQNDAEEVTVPAGKFKCVKVHISKITGDETDDETDWYAPGVGLVKLKSKKYLKELKSYNVK